MNCNDILAFTKDSIFSHGSTEWAGDGCFLLWLMETLGENADACSKSIFIPQIHNYIDPSR